MAEYRLGEWEAIRKTSSDGFNRNLKEARAVIKSYRKKVGTAWILRVSRNHIGADVKELWFWSCTINDIEHNGETENQFSAKKAVRKTISKIKSMEIE